MLLACLLACLLAAAAILLEDSLADANLSSHLQGADLDFEGVIARCNAVLLVAQALPGVAGLEHLPDMFQSESDESDESDDSESDESDESDDSDEHVRSETGPTFAIPQDERSLVAACRAWCLVRVILLSTLY